MRKALYQPALYSSPIDLPERTQGKVSVKHHIYKKEVTVVSMREMVTRGAHPCKATLSQPLRVHELIEEGHGLWMSDHPQELNQIAEMLFYLRPRGRVLVGGLGLGIVAETLSTQRPDVKRVTVVEKSANVIALCSTNHYEVVKEDILNFLWHHPTTDSFDYYLLDTWCGTNEGTWWDTVLPLRRAIRNRFGKKPVIHCWAEDQMQGQVRRQLTRLDLPAHWYYQEPYIHLSDPAAKWFLRYVGTPEWETKYGAAYDRCHTHMETRRKEQP